MRAAANYRPAAEGAFYLNLSPMWAAAAVTCWSGHLGLDLNNIAAGGRQLSFAGSQVNLDHVSQRNNRAGNEPSTKFSQSRRRPLQGPSAG